MRLPAAAVAVAILAVASCARPPRDHAPANARFERIDEPSLENAFLVAPRVISGGQPEGEAGFDALAALGVRTVISVDGARPDVEGAEARGMRYVHLPIGYDAVPAQRRLELARALRDLPGPAYLHCHHGAHRGPAATAAALVTLGVLTPEAGERFLTEAGVSVAYPGLYASVRASARAPSAALDAAPDDFPSVAQVGGFVEAMAALDRAFDHLTILAGAGWAAPPTHPDLVAGAEAGLLTDAMRAARADPAHTDDPDVRERLGASLTLAARLEAMLVGGRGAEASSLLPLIDAECRACHRAHRNAR